MEIFKVSQVIKKYGTVKEKQRLLRILYRFSGLIQNDDLDEEIWKLEQELEEDSC